MSDDVSEFILWGCMRALDYAPIRITGGSLRDCKAAMRMRQTEGAAWRGLAIYGKGTGYPPELADHYARMP
jgi:hypothetical protein